MSSNSKLAIYHDRADTLLAFTNVNCPVWVEGSIGSNKDSILLMDTKLSTEAICMLSSLQLYIAEGYTPSGLSGHLYQLSIADVERLKTISQNYFLPPWQEARLKDQSDTDDACNDTKAILVWLSYWLEYAINQEVEPYLQIDVAPF